MKTSTVDKMNDIIEASLYASQDKFVCFMGSTIESFGMWAMYGGLGKQLKNSASEIPNDMFVKIEIPVCKLKELVKNDKNLSLRKIVYSSLKPTVGVSPKGVIFMGKNVNKNGINISDPCLKGYIKDNAWSYENEVRLIKMGRSPYIDISSIINYCKVFPTPKYSLELCKLTYSKIVGNKELKFVPDFRQNGYEGLVRI